MYNTSKVHFFLTESNTKSSEALQDIKQDFNKFQLKARKCKNIYKKRHISNEENFSRPKKTAVLKENPMYRNKKWMLQQDNLMKQQEIQT
jgi:hypothetical protein